MAKRKTQFIRLVNSRGQVCVRKSLIQDLGTSHTNHKFQVTLFYGVEPKRFHWISDDLDTPEEADTLFGEIMKGLEE